MNWRPGIRTQIVFILTVLMTGVAVLVGIVFLKVEEPDLRRITAQMDPRSPGFQASDQKLFNGLQIRFFCPFRSVRKGVGGNESDLPVSAGDSLLERFGKIGYPSMAKTVAEDAGGLAKMATV